MLHRDESNGYGFTALLYTIGRMAINTAISASPQIIPAMAMPFQGIYQGFFFFLRHSNRK